MHEIITTALSKTELLRSFEDNDCMPVGAFNRLLELAADGPQVLETSTPYGAPWAANVLIFALPGASDVELQSLAEAMPEAYNETTADLLKKSSYLGWNAAGIEVRLDLWCCRQFNLITAYTDQILVIFMNQTSAVLAAHTFDEEGRDCFTAGLQGCCIQSGPNYNPWRIFSEAEIAAAEAATTVERANVRTAKVRGLVWND